MARKFNNKTLLIVLVVLVGLFFISKALRQKRVTGTLDVELVQIDTTEVNTILLYPQVENGEEIRFNRSGLNWTVSKGEITARADNQGIKNMFSELLSISPDRLVARDEEKWVDFGVNDSLGTRVIMKEGKKTVLDLMVGRFDYQPAPSTGYGGYGRNQGTGLTYVRKTDQSEVYVVQGFLAMSFNQRLNNWRNQLLLQTTKNNLTKITLDYPADSGFIAMKVDTVWKINGFEADSASMEQYLNGLSRKFNSSFVDDFTPLIAPDFQLTIEGNNMLPVIVKAYRRSDDEYILNSSQNPESWFSSSSSGIFRNLFKPKSELLQ